MRGMKPNKIGSHYYSLLCGSRLRAKILDPTLTLISLADHGMTLRSHSCIPITLLRSIIMGRQCHSQRTLLRPTTKTTVYGTKILDADYDDETDANANALGTDNDPTDAASAYQVALTPQHCNTRPCLGRSRGARNQQQPFVRWQYYRSVLWDCCGMW
jgi:hypothetical protein